jgi:hypothetical protein
MFAIFQHVLVSWRLLREIPPGDMSLIGFSMSHGGSLRAVKSLPLTDRFNPIDMVFHNLVFQFQALY